MTGLDKLAPYDGEGALRVVVEAPRGCGLKLKYDPALGAFTYGRPLPLGLTYPCTHPGLEGRRAREKAGAQLQAQRRRGVTSLGVSTTLRFVALRERAPEWSKLARQMKGPECNGGKAS